MYSLCFLSPEPVAHSAPENHKYGPHGDPLKGLIVYLKNKN